MKGFNLSLSSSTYQTVGVLANAYENLRIINGSLENMGLDGIKCVGCINALIKKMVIDGLYVNEIAEYTVPMGILATSCIGVAIEKCHVRNINVKTGSCAGIQFKSYILQISLV
jgi:vacuolar-type H+-ATPase subunit I/STV1